MSDEVVIIAQSGRHFAAHAVGLIALIIDEQERFLMLSSPQRPGKWEPVNGAYDGNELLIDAFLREIREEAGDQIQVRPISAVHVYNFPFDNRLRLMVSIIFLFQYQGGEVIPGDDMAGSEIKWMSLDEIAASTVIVPNNQPWVYERAVRLYRLLKDETVMIQPPLDSMRSKYSDS